MLVRKAEAGDDAALIGVAKNMMARNAVEEVNGKRIGGFGERTGKTAATGEYLSVVVHGLAQVRASGKSAAKIAIGDRLTIGEGGSTRVSVSAEARARLAEEESTGVREQQSEASEEQGPVAKLLEIQKERVASASEDNALPPPSTRPETEDRGSIRAAEQRLASAGLTV